MTSSSNSTIRDSYPTILFVDDEPAVLKSLGRFCRGKPWSVHFASSGDEGLAILKKEKADVVVSDMRMPRMSGTEFLTTVRQLYPETILILLTGYADMDALEGAINNAKIYNYVTKPWDEYFFSDVLDKACQNHVWRQNQKNQQHQVEKDKRKLSKLALLLDKKTKEKGIETKQALTLLASANEQAESNLNELLDVLVHLISWQDNTADNNQFISEYSIEVAKELGLSAIDIKNTAIASKLHNVGLLGLSEEIRNKPYYSFSKPERSKYQEHGVLAEAILKSVPSLNSVAKIIRSHHEYINGTGFPDQLFGDNIPLPARIICAVSDYYELFHARLVKNISGHKASIAYLQKNIGKLYDTNIVNILTKLIGDSPKYMVCSKSLLPSMLESGMVLKQDVKTRQGIVLLAKGAQLNDLSIKKLMKYQDDFNVSFEVHIT